jgi:glycosyltransferase involved in cell wall biosynthesis
MNIVLFTHPAFLTSQSMPRFANMLANGMRARGHEVETVTPEATFYKLPFPQKFKKWLGYIDQYLVFPKQVQRKLKQYPTDTLFVFADNALGPWVPIVKNRPHVIHCHDFLAQQSALGQVEENATGFTGQKYQAYIRDGYRQGQNFISVSYKTRQDLHSLMLEAPNLSEVVYNGLNEAYQPGNITEARKALSAEIGIDLSKGYLLHIGGNQWYKNRTGVVEIYNEWCKTYHGSLPLLLIGASPNPKLAEAIASSDYKDNIYTLSGKDDDFVKQAYIGASVFLFPSINEGFGWPIAEAMASGGVVITTGATPMNEVGGDAAIYIPRLTKNNAVLWKAEAAEKLNVFLTLTPGQQDEIRLKGIENAKRFSLDAALNQIEDIYKKIITDYKKA